MQLRIRVTQLSLNKLRLERTFNERENPCPRGLYNGHLAASELCTKCVDSRLTAILAVWVNGRTCPLVELLWNTCPDRDSRFYLHQPCGLSGCMHLYLYVLSWPTIKQLTIKMLWTIFPADSRPYAFSLGIASNKKTVPADKPTRYTYIEDNQLYVPVLQNASSSETWGLFYTPILKIASCMYHCTCSAEGQLLGNLDCG